MKKINNLYSAFRTNNVIIVSFVIMLFITVALCLLGETGDCSAVLLLQMLIITVMVIVNCVIYSSRYKVLCKELTLMIENEAQKQSGEKIEVSCSIITKKHYIIVEPVIRGRLNGQIYLNCSNAVNDYLDDVEALIGKPYLLNIVNGNYN